MPLVDELLIEIPAFEERLRDALVVEGVEDVGDVAAVDVVFAGVDDDGAGDGELFADVAAAGGASLGVARGGVDAGEPVKRLRRHGPTGGWIGTGRSRCRRR